MEEISIKTIHKELEMVKKIVVEMKEYIEDCFLTPEEEKTVDKAREEFERGETISLEYLELERKNAQS